MKNSLTFHRFGVTYGSDFMLVHAIDENAAWYIAHTRFVQRFLDKNRKGTELPENLASVYRFKQSALLNPSTRK